ncbi:efflux transporter outer membrane subunit [Sphingomonas sp. CGMCC 1.13654]|uniref:Efflux transporter outer membrane subunit n=1 Tax=Sphingomonas chungangi TaxID=2683589 RepID=A0A838L8E7_9SPHN|nr:efflux transporter outer membrane subunit [Sphingomonas chungangi]MBA2935581.1 efflux transporter outer membrane subunit [Sphingomonas chungangi]MVW54272.1 efflux transporter outer membrane subunit [Sphingomonas chungangi]
MRSSKPAVAAALLALSGCSLAPDYHRPEVAAATTYKEVPNGWTVASPAADAPPAAWWGAFDDPVLTDLEGRIEKGSPSLAIAVARYDEAVGQLHEARADLYPTIGVGGSAERDRTSAHAPTSKGVSSTYNDYTAGASFSWELDLFGRIRNQVKANKGEAQASAADLAGVRLGLQTSLATAYFQMRGLDAREGLLRQTVDAYQRAYELTDVRHSGGIASGLDTSRARAQLASAKAELASLPSQRAAYEHAIAVLVGESPSIFSLPADARQSAPPAFPTGTPSTLLQRRPDIDAAERRVYAANARIGVARAAFFPAISLGGAGGFETTGPNLLSTASSFWALGPASLALTVFDGGKRAAQVRVSRAEFNEASATYKQTVLTAFKEVEDDLASGRDLVAQEKNQRDAVQASETTRDLALTRYRDGASDYLEVVTAQTAALDAERSLLDLHTQQLTTAVDTVRALGGVAR